MHDDPVLTSSQIEKLMEMSSSMTEYLAMQPASRDPFAVGPREHLNQILSMVAVARNGDYRFLPLLLNKLGEVLPRMTNPMLQNAPENSNLANIDIFDGFGTAGMAQPPSQMHMAMDSDYDRKFSVEEYEKKYAMEMNGNTPESATHSNHSNSSPSIAQQGSDMGGSFVSSPSIMSPGMEYPHSMNGFSCNPMNEMVMSPIGNPGQSNPISQGQHMGHDGISQRMNGLSAQNMRQQGMNSMNSLGGMGQIQQRQSSFHMSGQAHMGDFHNLQRGNSDASNSMVGINTMGAY